MKFCWFWNKLDLVGFKCSKFKIANFWFEWVVSKEQPNK
jgi:hypothetical protein